EAGSYLAAFVERLFAWSTSEPVRVTGTSQPVSRTAVVPRPGALEIGAAQSDIESAPVSRGWLAALHLPDWLERMIGSDDGPIARLRARGAETLRPVRKRVWFLAGA